MSMKDLLAYDRVTQALASVAGRTGWDQETVMPRGAVDMRAEELGALESVLHARRTDPQLGDWLDSATPEGDVETAQLREIRRDYDRATKVPADLASALATLTSRSQDQWAKARGADDFAGFAPVLTEVLALKRQEAQAIADGGDAYDALLQDYEPGQTAADIAARFDALRPGLVALRDRVLGADTPAPLSGSFDPDTQLIVAREALDAFGYDWTRGRMDRAVHPFCSGGGQDVRVTTRTDASDPFNCLYSAIHEGGHAGYEQNIAPEFMLTALGGGVSMGVHESQSRLYENQLGRSEAVCDWLHGRMEAAFDMGIDAASFYAAANRVTQGFIRTEADELSYNLHIMMRFDLERDLISGALDVSDLEDAWNDRFKADFGQDVPKASLGVLQDVHWPVGLFGYFPTYALGNLYAAGIMETMETSIGDWRPSARRGDLTAPLGWLAENVQRSGSLYEPADLMTRVCGAVPDEAPLLRYLEAKFSALYRV